MTQRRLVETVDLRRYADAGRELVPWRGGEVLPADSDMPIIRIGARPEPAEVAHETHEPRREPKLESDVLVPLAQATITAGAVGIMAALLAWAAGWGWRVPVVAFALALAGGWLWRLRLVDALLWNVERWTGTDLNGDGVKGRPTVSYTVANPGQARATVARENRTAEDDAKRAALLAFCDACFVKGCSEAAHGVKASGPDRVAFVTQRDVLLSLGIARWRNPQRPKAGWVMAVSRERARQIITKHVL